MPRVRIVLSLCVALAALPALAAEAPSAVVVEGIWLPAHLDGFHAQGDTPGRGPMPSAEPSESLALQPPASTSAPRRRVRRVGSERMPEVDPASPGPSTTSQLLAEGQQRFDTGDIDGALRSARSAIRVGGGAPAHLLAGRALAKKSQLRDAEHELAIAARLDPTNALAAQRLQEIRERLQATTSSPE